MTQEVYYAQLNNEMIVTQCFLNHHDIMDKPEHKVFNTNSKPVINEKLKVNTIYYYVGSNFETSEVILQAKRVIKALLAGKQPAKKTASWVLDSLESSLIIQYNHTDQSWEFINDIIDRMLITLK